MEIKSDKSTGDGYIAGRNSVTEALRSGRQIDRLVIERGRSGGSMRPIIAMAHERGIPIKEVAPEKLSAMCPSTNHQGVIAVAAMKDYCTVDDILNTARERGESPFIIICDEIEDPHNLGAIIRTAEICGAHGVIIPKRRSVGLNFAVAKSACGALEYMNVARVTNIAAEIDRLKSEGVWVYAADMNGEDSRSVDYSGAAALVIGGVALSQMSGRGRKSEGQSGGLPAREETHD